MVEEMGNCLVCKRITLYLALANIADKKICKDIQTSRNNIGKGGERGNAWKNIGNIRKLQGRETDLYENKMEEDEMIESQILLKQHWKMA